MGATIAGLAEEPAGISEVAGLLDDLEELVDLAKQTIEEGMAILGAGDYWGYNQHCVAAKSDARDAGQVFRYLRGPMSGAILEMTFTDAGELYHQPPPTWVAGALMEWRLI